MCDISATICQLKVFQIFYDQTDVVKYLCVKFDIILIQIKVKKACMPQYSRLDQITFKLCLQHYCGNLIFWHFVRISTEQSNLCGQLVCVLCNFHENFTDLIDPSSLDQVKFTFELHVLYCFVNECILQRIFVDQHSMCVQHYLRQHGSSCPTGASMEGLDLLVLYMHYYRL